MLSVEFIKRGSGVCARGIVSPVPLPELLLIGVIPALLRFALTAARPGSAA
jgi:hypothetical protein